MKFVISEALGLVAQKLSLAASKNITKILFLGFIALAFSGCAQNQYHVNDLPAQYAAQPVPNLDSLNLSSFATQGTGHDTIAWGDELRINVNSGYEPNPPEPVVVRVARDGSVAIPSVGRVFVAGFEIETAESMIAMESRKRQIYPNPFVAIQFSKRRATQITVTGAVESPGTYSLQRGESSLMAAIIAAGGLSKDADAHIQVKRVNARGAISNVQQVGMTVDPATGRMIPAPLPHRSRVDKQVIQVNLLEPVNGQVPGKYALHEGDVITVPRRKLPAIHVLGLVKQPGLIELTGEHDIHVLEAISRAGGISSKPADRVLVLRRGETSGDEPVRIVVSIQKAMNGNDNLRLSPGDTIIVRNTPATVLDEVFRTFVRMTIGGSAALW